MNLELHEIFVKNNSLINVDNPIFVIIMNHDL